jgi:hypothetical protein
MVPPSRKQNSNATPAPNVSPEQATKAEDDGWTTVTYSLRNGKKRRRDPPKKNIPAKKPSQSMTRKDGSATQAGPSGESSQKGKVTKDVQGTPGPSDTADVETGVENEEDVKTPDERDITPELAAEIDSVRTDVEKKQAILKESEEWHLFQKKLVTGLDHIGKPIDTAIILALGSLDEEDPERPGQLHWRCHWQFALFLNMLEIMTQVPRKITLYAQEPRFREIDHYVLSSYGITILPRLNARDYLSPTAFVFSAFMEWTTLYLEVLDGREVGLMLAPSLEEVDDFIQTAPE